MQYLRLLLLPFSVLYGIIIWLRNKLYDLDILPSQKFETPVISIGNLAVGGAGKSPMAEYLIRLLQNKHKTAVLSRGYKRETKGFRLVTLADTVAEAGDEPLQFRRKFDNLTVAVSEKRVLGIEQLKHNHDVIILDDAFQHRAVKPGLSLLLFDYISLDERLVVLPAGNLREPFFGRKRAHVLMVTKCPPALSRKEKHVVLRKVKPFKNQRVFFSYLEYGDLISVSAGGGKPLSQLKPFTIYLLSGIANAQPLVDMLKEVSQTLNHHQYPDHHAFSEKNISKLADEFRACPAADKIIITTEKDFQRLQHPNLTQLLKDLPVYYLPVSAKIHAPDEERFNNLILNYVTKHLQHHSLHKE